MPYHPPAVLIEPATVKTIGYIWHTLIESSTYNGRLDVYTADRE